MLRDKVFSWAMNEEGRMVHVDSVLNGLKCNCTCPHCKEKLMARHGVQRAHGFAHQSEDRGANLEICYMVILYKVAEQIVQQKKKIFAPSYYGIFNEGIIEFVDVKIDDRYDREDRQPDVIATTATGKQYLIEFIFAEKVQHNTPIDYKNLNCLEIDLSRQTHDSVEKFLLEESADRRWINHQQCFGNIEEKYKINNKNVRLKLEEECKKCPLFDSCLGVKSKDFSSPLVIKNNGLNYRICKLEQYEKYLKAYQQKKIDKEEKKKDKETLKKDYERAVRLGIIKETKRQAVEYGNINIDPRNKTCYMCEYCFPTHNIEEIECKRFNTILLSKSGRACKAFKPQS